MLHSYIIDEARHYLTLLAVIDFAYYPLLFYSNALSSAEALVGRTQFIESALLFVNG